MTDSLIHKYVEYQKKLLNLELQHEQEENKDSFSQASLPVPPTSGEERDEGLKSSSRILSNLLVDSWSIGLLGRTIVIFSTFSSTTSAANENSGNKSLLLPAHRLSVGDQVEILHKSNPIHNNGGNSRESGVNKRNRLNFNGVISAVTDRTISVALSNHHQNRQHMSNNSDEEENGILGLSSPPYTILPQSSVDVHRKLLKSLDILEKYGEGHHYAGSVIRTIFDTSSPSSSLSPTSKGEVIPFNQNLDTSQLDAIEFALYGDSPISLIHGPPGTGKTTTVAELIHQAVHIHKWRVLVTAPSNVAVDNILERLVTRDNSSKSKKQYSIKKKQTASRRRVNTANTQTITPINRAVRLGHPARIQPSTLPFSLEALVSKSDGTEIVKDIRSELKEHLEILSNPKHRGGDKRVAYREMKLLRKEIRQREEKVVEGLLLDAQVVLSTNVGAASSVLNKLENSPSYRPFDLVVIDEAAQALEASCWIPILRGKRLVLAGDHLQLPPTIKSRNSEVRRELGKTLFERIMKRHGDGNIITRNEAPMDAETVRSNELSRMLTVQYRMHEDIAQWASNAMYGGHLQSHELVKARKLYHLPHVPAESDASLNSPSMQSTIKNATLLLIDTAGCEMLESTNAAGSRYNEGEAELVARHVRNLLNIGLKAEEIAVITPYNGQVELLRTMLLDVPNLEIRSVDGFQGSEREAVVLSLVRSSERGGINGIGFLKDERRLNVAVTRAMRQCCVICDSETVGQNSFLKNLTEWFEEKGEYISAEEFNENIQSNQVASTSEEIVQLRVILENPSKIAKTLDDDSPAQPKIGNTVVEDHTKRGPSKVRQTGADLEKLSDDVYDKLHLFAEVAENGEEMEVTIPCTVARDLVHNICSSLGLLIMNAISVDFKRKITVCAMSEVQQEEEKQRRRSELTDRLASFADNAESGVMTLSDYSLKFDYSLIPEICEKLKLAYKVQASDETDICFIYGKEIEYAARSNGENDLDKKPSTQDSTLNSVSETVVASPLDNFQISKKCRSETKDDISEPNSANTKTSQVNKGMNKSGGMNNLLNSLAKERTARSISKTNVNKGKKSGGASKVKKGKKSGNGEGLDILDDMAFLDSEIQKVQTLHGRTIEARGSNYRSIVNGILTAKPKQQEKERNNHASTALKQKIKNKQSQRNRKKKK